ncbi:hypothetical protein [Pontibacter ummariensis]|uniref:hypothetical protein n=1 Tax=Pontibacter ummariensis TaxID=1610492 RepID=UPI00358F2076
MPVSCCTCSCVAGVLLTCALASVDKKPKAAITKANTVAFFMTLFLKVFTMLIVSLLFPYDITVPKATLKP